MADHASGPSPPITDTVLRALLGAAGVVVLVAGLRAGSTLLVPLVVAAFVAAICYPLVRWLRRWFVPTPIAVGITLAAILAVQVGPGLVVLEAMRQFVVAAPRYQARLLEMTATSFAWLDTHGVDTSRLSDIINYGALLDLIGALFSNITFLLSNTFLVLLVVAFLLVEASRLPGRLLDALVIGPEAVARFRRMLSEVQTYLLVKTLVSVATGVLAALWTAFLGLDFVVVWGLLAFLLNYIPAFGSIMAGVPPVVLALIQISPGRALAVALGYLAINIALGSVTEPYLMGRRLRLSPLMILLSLIFWGWVWGPVGMVLAVPIMMVVRISMEHVPDLRWIAVMVSDDRPPRWAPAGGGPWPLARQRPGRTAGETRNLAGP